MITREELIRELKQQVKEVGSQKALALKLGISQQYLSDVLHNVTIPGPRRLSVLKLKPVVMYMKVYETQGSTAAEREDKDSIDGRGNSTPGSGDCA